MSEDNLLENEEYKKFIEDIKKNSDYIDLAENFGPLLFYIKNNDLESIKKNVKIPENINIKDGITSNNIFHFIAEYGNKEVFDYMKEKVKLGINEVNREGETPIFKAVKFNRKDMVEKLMDSGANINIKDNNKYTLLNITTLNGYRDIFEKLIKKGLEPDREDFQNIFEKLSSESNSKKEKKTLSNLLDYMVKKSKSADILLEKNEEEVAPIDFVKTKKQRKLISRGCSKRTKNKIRAASVRKSAEDLREKENRQNIEKEKVNQEVLSNNLKNITNINIDFPETKNQEQSTTILR